MKMKRNTKRTIIALGLAASMLMSVGAMSVSAASEEMVSVPESVQQSPQTEEGLEILTKDMETEEEYVEVVPPTNDGRTSNMIPSTIPEEYEEYLLPPAPSFQPYAIMGSDDERYEVGYGDINKYVKAICYVEVTNKYGDVLGSGTGFVVGGNVVVTAGHVIYDKFDYGGYGPVIKVYPQRKDSKMPLGVFTATKCHVTNEYADPKKSDKEKEKFDIGIIRVNSNIASKTGSFGMKYTTNPNSLTNTEVTVAGYPEYIGKDLNIYAGYKQYTMKGPITRIQSENNLNDNQQYSRLFYNTLDTSSGQSGSAIHTTGFTAIGVHTNGYDNENAGVMFNKVYYDWIRQYI